MEGVAIERDGDLLGHLVRLLVPERKASAAWMWHAPLGKLLVVNRLALPTVLVELETSTGLAYCTFCTFFQAVEALQLDTRCFAADTRGDDLRGGRNPDDVFEDLKKNHVQRYGAFSTLPRSPLDDAPYRFADRSIALWRLNGPRTYQAARHGAETWLPTMSRRSILVPHGVNERASEAVVWRRRSELAAIYPPFEVQHGYGLGAVSVGSETPRSMRPERATALPETLYALRQRVEAIQRVEAHSQQILATERRGHVQTDELGAQHEARHRRTNSRRDTSSRHLCRSLGYANWPKTDSGASARN